MDHQHKVSWEKTMVSLHSVHEILENILGRVSEDNADRISECLNPDSKDRLNFLEWKAHTIHELAKEVEFKLSGCREMERKAKSRMESMISSLKKENQETTTMLKIAIAEKEAAENSLRILRGDDDHGKSTILQIAGKGLKKVGFGFIMEVISGESEREETSRSSATTASDERENVQESIGLASIVGKTMKNLHHDINDLRQALHESRSDCDCLELLAAEQAQKMVKHESHIQYLEERESFLVDSVEELTAGVKEIQQEAARWRQACEMEVEAGKAAIKELNQEVTLLREELGRVKADLEAANSKLELKDKLATSAMAAQAAADACLKIADTRSAGLQQRIEELTRQIEKEDAHPRKERERAHRRIRYVCWPWQQLQVVSASSRARTWFVDQNGRLLPRTEVLLQIRM